MKRVVVDRPGGLRRLRVEEVPDPTPGAGELAIAVHAAGVNYADVMVRMGLYASARHYVGYPICPGFEVAGQVCAAGEGVHEPRVGEPVVAVTRFGGYTSRLVVPAEQACAVPENVSLQDAAGVPTVFMTAWYALHRLAGARPGAQVLVHSAAGGVGLALLQLARAQGIRAFGVVGGAHKVDTARAAGAESVVDRGANDVWAEAERWAPDGFDAVFDPNGPATLKASYRHLAPMGRLVVYGFHTMLRRGAQRPSLWRMAIGLVRMPRFSPLRMTGENRSVMAFNLSYLFEEKALMREGMNDILAGLRDGRLHPLPTTAYPLQEAAEAHRALSSGTTVGKLVLTV